MTREEILRNIVCYSGDIKSLAKELSAFEWDSDELITISGSDIKNVITQTLDGKITAWEIEFWANVIEIRDDLGFENDNVKDAVFQLANPVLHGELLTARLKEIGSMIA